VSLLRSSLYECTVMHHRFTPKEHHFNYRIFLFVFDLDELPELHRRLPLFSLNRPNLFSFRENDFFPTTEPLHHGSGESPGPRASEATVSATPATLKARLRAHLAARGINLGGGRILLVTLPRVCGYLFNPVSFYFCYDAAGTCVAALAEVTNTFREMKPYFLGPETAVTAHPGTFHRRTPKYFYVSPFSDVDTAFDFTLRAPGERLAIQIDDYVGADRTLTSTLAGPRRELTSLRLAWFTLKYPLITLRIIALIHWHAALLWVRRLPWFAKAARSTDQRDLYRPHASIAATSTVAPKLPAPTEAA